MIVSAGAAYRQTSTLWHRVNGVYDQVDKHLAQLGGTAVRRQIAFGQQPYLIVEPAQARFVVPARAGDLDCIFKQAAHINILKFRSG